LVFTDFAGVAVDPETLAISIKDRLGIEQKALTLTDLLPKDSVGHYHYHYDTSSTATPGTWLITSKATIADLDEVSETILRVNASGSIWAEADDVIADAGNPTFGNVGFTSKAIMEAHIENFILPAAQNHINQYLHQGYTTFDVPDAVRYCAIRVAARGLMNIAINKKGGLITVNQWMQALADPTVFTPELKAEIADFVLSRASHTARSLYKTREIKETWDED